MYSLNKLSDDDIPIPIPHICKLERLGKDLTAIELHEFGLSLFITILVVQDGKLIAVNMNPENGTPHVLVENPQKVLVYFWVKTDLDPNIPVYVPQSQMDKYSRLRVLRCNLQGRCTFANALTLLLLDRIAFTHFDGYPLQTAKLSIY
jgi:hypothetical protein